MLHSCAISDKVNPATCLYADFLLCDNTVASIDHDATKVAYKTAVQPLASATVVLIPPVISAELTLL